MSVTGKKGQDQAAQERPLFLFLIEDSDGDLNLVTLEMEDGGILPLVTDNTTLLDKYVKLAQKVADETGCRVEICEFRRCGVYGIVVPRATPKSQSPDFGI